MNSYFFGITKEEKENILDQHKKPYDGYVTQYIKPEVQPLYVQDFANDKEGLTVNNKGEVKHHTYMGINEDIFSGSHGFEPEVSFEETETKEQLDMIGDGSDDLEHGTFDDEDIDEKEFCRHCGGLGYDENTDEECEWCDGTGIHDDLHISNKEVFPKTKWSYDKNIDLEIDEELQEPLQEQVNKTLDMFRRFKQY